MWRELWGNGQQCEIYRRRIDQKYLCSRNTATKASTRACLSNNLYLLVLPAKSAIDSQSPDTVARCRKRGILLFLFFLLPVNFYFKNYYWPLRIGNSHIFFVLRIVENRWEILTFTIPPESSGMCLHWKMSKLPEFSDHEERLSRPFCDSWDEKKEISKNYTRKILFYRFVSSTFIEWDKKKVFLLRCFLYFIGDEDQIDIRCRKMNRAFTDSRNAQLTIYPAPDLLSGVEGNEKNARISSLLLLPNIPHAKDVNCWWFCCVKLSTS